MKKKFFFRLYHFNEKNYFRQYFFRNSEKNIFFKEIKYEKKYVITKHSENVAFLCIFRSFGTPFHEILS